MLRTQLQNTIFANGPDRSHLVNSRPTSKRSYHYLHCDSSAPMQMTLSDINRLSAIVWKLFKPAAESLTQSSYSLKSC